VADIFLKAKAALAGDDYPLMYGPAHVVWSDENWHLAQDCIDAFDKYRRDLTDEQARVVRHSLEQLAALPQSAWDVEPEDYDEEHPENYPPPEGVEMVKV
jgi:hypothetical protein